jgi:hypothetical protein
MKRRRRGKDGNECWMRSFRGGREFLPLILLNGSSRRRKGKKNKKGTRHGERSDAIIA